MSMSGSMLYIYVYGATFRVNFMFFVKHNVKVIIRLKAVTTAGSLSCPDQAIFQVPYPGQCQGHSHGNVRVINGRVHDRVKVTLKS